MYNRRTSNFQFDMVFLNATHRETRVFTPVVEHDRCTMITNMIKGDFDVRNEGTYTSS